MTALARLIGKWLEGLLDWDADSPISTRLLRGILAATLICAAAALSYMKLKYNLSLGPN